MIKISKGSSSRIELCLELKNLCKLKHELHTVCKSSTTFYAIMCKGKVQKNPKTIIKC